MELHSAGEKKGGNGLLGSLLKSIERPSPLGVMARKLVIWNTHNGQHNDFGARECTVRLFANGREIWSKDRLAMPWAPNEDCSLTVALPPGRFDRVRRNHEVGKNRRRPGRDSGVVD